MTCGCRYFLPTITVSCLGGIDASSVDDDRGQYFLLSICQDSTPSSSPRLPVGVDDVTLHARCTPAATSPAAVWNVDAPSSLSPVGSFTAAPSYSKVALAYFWTGLVSLVTVDSLLACVDVGFSLHHCYYADIRFHSRTSCIGVTSKRASISYPRRCRMSASWPDSTGPWTSLRLFPGYPC